MQALYALIILLGFFGLPILLGYFSGKTILYRVPEWVTWIIFFAGGAGVLLYIQSCRHLPPQKMTEHLLLSVPIMFVWMFFTMSTMIGRQQRKFGETSEQKLVQWQARLEQDQSAHANALAIAYDLQMIGDLNTKLGHKEAAASALGEAVTLSVAALGEHPKLHALLYSYGFALQRVKRYDDATKVFAQADAIVSPDKLQ